MKTDNFKKFFDLCKKHKLKISIAESCTGGLIASHIIRIPGSSSVIDSSFVVYSNISKIQILEVPKLLINKYGAVSREVAISMANNTQRIRKVDLTISTTGIAGPSGGSEKKPVGLVYHSVKFKKTKTTYCRRMIYSGDRAEIQDKATCYSIKLASKIILNTM